MTRRKRLIWIGITLSSLVIIAGCGIKGSVKTQSNGNGTHNGNGSAVKTVDVPSNVSSPTTKTSGNSDTTSSTDQSALFNGTVTTWRVGNTGPMAMPNGYTGNNHLVYTSSTYSLVESITGTLKGQPFILDFYKNYPIGLYIGINYRGNPVYFGTGPAPIFSILNLTGNWVVLGTPSAAAYEAINLTSGKTIIDPKQVTKMKGYAGLGKPPHVLGLSQINFSTDIPYSP